MSMMEDKKNTHAPSWSSKSRREKLAKASGVAPKPGATELCDRSRGRLESNPKKDMAADLTMLSSE